jgi:hypothetical protein
MKRFVEGEARDQGGLFPAHLDDFIGEDNPVRAVDVFVEMLDLHGLGQILPWRPSITNGRVGQDQSFRAIDSNWGRAISNRDASPPMNRLQTLADAA